MKIFLILLAAVLLPNPATACDGHGSETVPYLAAAEARKHPGPAESPDKAGPLRIAYLQNDIHHLALWVSLAQGYLTEGKDVEIAGVFRAGPEIMSAFAAGALDMAYVGLAPTVTAVANQTAGVVVVSQANAVGSALVVGADSTIGAVGDLKGRTVAIPGHATVQDFLVKRTLHDHRIDLKSVQMIVLKPPEMITALRSGQIDAFIAWEPYPSQAAALKVGRNLIVSREIWPDHPCCVVVASNRLMAAHPEKVRTFVTAHRRATDFIRRNPQEAEAVAVQYTGLDHETVRQAMANVDFNDRLNVASAATYVAFLSDLGYIRIADPDAFIEALIQPVTLTDD